MTPVPTSVKAHELTDAELREYLAFAGTLADAAAGVVRPLFRAGVVVDDKSRDQGYDPVTVADREAEAAMRSLIRTHCPSHGIFGEEHGRETGSSPLTWVLDPIDGTRAFITGMPLWGTLIALNDGHRPVLGIMDQPYTGERFIGSRLGGILSARDGTHTLEVRPCAALEDATLLCTHPGIFDCTIELPAFRALEGRVKLTRYGGDCYAYCMLAHGFADLVVEAGLQPYDIQALIPIIEAAGGIVTDWTGGPAWNGGQVLAAGDHRLHALALQVLAEWV